MEKIEFEVTLSKNPKREQKLITAKPQIIELYDGYLEIHTDYSFERLVKEDTEDEDDVLAKLIAGNTETKTEVVSEHSTILKRNITQLSWSWDDNNLVFYVGMSLVNFNAFLNMKDLKTTIDVYNKLKAWYLG